MKNKVLSVIFILMAVIFNDCKAPQDDLPYVEKPDDPITGWSRKAQLLTPRGAHFVGFVNEKIYAVGGFLYASSSVEEYDLTTDTWTAITDMPTPRGDFSGCVLNDKLYATGGWLDNVTFSTVEEYDPATDTWTNKAPMLDGRWGHATVTVNGKIYVIGGATGWPSYTFR